MSATAVSLAPNEDPETVDFLRRLASMMSGGKNAEMLLAAASMIEALTERAMTAERLHSELQDQHERSNELRAVAELAADNLNAELDALKGQLADAIRRAEIDRADFAEKTLRLSAMVEDAESRVAKANAQLDELRTPFAELSQTVVAGAGRTVAPRAHAVRFPGRRIRQEWRCDIANHLRNRPLRDRAGVGRQRTRQIIQVI